MQEYERLPQLRCAREKEIVEMTDSASAKPNGLPPQEVLEALTLEALNELGGVADRREIRDRAIELGRFTPEQIARKPAPARAMHFTSLLEDQLCSALIGLRKQSRVKKLGRGRWQLVEEMTSSRIEDRPRQVVAKPVPDAESMLGQRIEERYVIESQLGAGGMGMVYRARDEVLDRWVALKLLRPNLRDDAVARTRFQREIRMMVDLEHPNVVPLYSAGYEDGQFYIVMRFVEGLDLAHLLSDGALDFARALRLFDQVSAGLAFMHRGGFVHRDVKPGNVLVARTDTPDEHALVGDFGIARALETATSITKGAVGTPGYVAPEVLDWRQPTPASDQYSLACVLFEMLTGQMPSRTVPGEGEATSAPGDGTEPGADLCALNPDVPPSLGLAVTRAFAMDPLGRFESVTAFAEAIRVAASERRLVGEAKEIETVEEFRSVRDAEIGIVVITGSRKRRPRAHRPTCDFVAENYFHEKTVRGKGSYYLASDLRTASVRFNAVPCNVCMPW